MLMNVAGWEGARLTTPPLARRLAGAAAFAAAAGCCVELRLPLLTIAARWVPVVYRRVELNASDVAMGLVVAFGLIGGSVPHRLARPGVLRSTIFQLLGVSLVGFLGLSSLDAVAPALSLARAAEVSIGVAFVLASIRLPELWSWILHACRLVILIELPLVLLQVVTQSTFPRETLLLGGSAEVPASAPGAWAIVGANGLRWQRALGSFPHPNVLGGFAALTIVLLIPRVFEGKFSSTSVVNQRLSVPRTLDLVVWLAAWVELLLTLSRAAALAALLGCVVMLVRWPACRGDRPGWRRAGVLIALAATVMIAAIIRAAMIGAGRTDPAVTDRLALVRIAFGLILAHPLLGVGAGNFSIVESLPPIDGAFVDPVHSVPLLVAAEAGVVAGLLWLAFSVVPVLLARWHGNAGRAGIRHVLGVTLVVLVLAALDHYLWTLAVGRTIFWIALVSLYSGGADAAAAPATLAPERSRSAFGVSP
jgi:O-antigen ligase